MRLPRTPEQLPTNTPSNLPLVPDVKNKTHEELYNILFPDSPRQQFEKWHLLPGAWSTPCSIGRRPTRHLPPTHS